jgi:uncharacterized protein (DUF488 family)
MQRPFFTIGHSTRPINDFIDLIRRADIRFVVDVRTVPRSRKNPDYNADILAATLSAFEIGYEHVATLGGLRARSRVVPPEMNSFWENQSFHNYADYAMGEEFRSGLARLRDIGHRATSVTMCAEAVWWRCHRRIIADYLIASGEIVLHILGPGHIGQARLSAGAALRADGALMYPAASRAKHLHRTAD